MNDRPTPETDAIKFRIEDSNHFAVHVVHARRLERERDDLLDRLTALEHSMPVELANLERERDEAREQLAAERALADRLADSLTACERWANQPCDVKTEANKALMEWKEARK